jgi:hypothetical protein
MAPDATIQFFTAEPARLTVLCDAVRGNATDASLIVPALHVLSILAHTDGLRSVIAERLGEDSFEPIAAALPQIRDEVVLLSSLVGSP